MLPLSRHAPIPGSRTTTISSDLGQALGLSADLPSSVHVGDVAAAAEVEVGEGQGGQPHRDDAPMTPVVYVVLWTSFAVGGLRGYASNSNLAARQTPSFTYTFTGKLQAAVLANHSPFCSSGVDGLPGVTVYEGLTSVLPPVLAPLLGAVYIRWRGRRSGIMVGCLMTIIGLVLFASATHAMQLYISQAVLWAGCDMLFLSIAAQDVEIAPRTSRGFFLLVHMLGYCVGCLSVALLGYFISNQNDLGWRLLFGMGVLPGLAVLFVLPWLYETPHSLIERGKYARGWAALREIRGPFYDDAYSEYMSIVRAAAAAPKGFRMYTALFSNRQYIPAIIVGLTMAILSALLDPLSRSYVSYQSLTRVGVRFQDAVLMTTLTMTGCFAIGTVVAVLLVDRVGRLPLLRASSLLAVVTLAVLVGGAVIYSEGHHVNLADTVRRPPQKWPYMQLATLCVLAAGNGVAWSSTAWVSIFESQALAVRPAAVGLSIASANFGASVIETHGLCLLKGYYYTFVLGCSIAALVMACFFVPETSRVSLEDITRVYFKHWFWSRFEKPKSGPRRPPSEAASNSTSDQQTSSIQQAPAGASAGSSQEAAAATAAAAAAAAAGAYGISPFSHKDVQLARFQSGGGAENSQTAAALAAAAMVASPAMSIPRLESGGRHDRLGRRPTAWLSGRRRSSQHADSAHMSDTIEELAEELRRDGS